jgi:predicted nucleotidyltransferase
MLLLSPAYPTPQHAAAADRVVSLFNRRPEVDTILLMGSCARGKAVVDSCIDILVLCRPQVLARSRATLESVWAQHYPSDPVFHELLNVGAYSNVDLEFIDGVFRQPPHGWTSGADEFELEIANTLAYTVPFGHEGSYYRELKAQWLPYYNEDLRSERLAMVLRYCRNNLDHIPLFAPRELYFQCFKRFYHAFEEFLQALFISRRTYPIAYDKWLHESVVEILGLPDLYARLPRLFEVRDFESQEIVEKAATLRSLVNEYIEGTDRV